MKKKKTKRIKKIQKITIRLDKKLKQPFFSQASFNPFQDKDFDPDIYVRMDRMRIRLMAIDAANEVWHHRLFDILVSSDKSWNHVLSLPLLPQSNSVRHVAVPFNIEDHGSITLLHSTLSALIERFINDTLSRRKYIFSCDPRYFVAAEIENFNYDAAFILAQNGGGNTDFIIFDEGFSTWMTYSTDRPFVIITQRVNGDASTDISGVSHEFWQRFFSENIDTAAKGCSDSYIEMFNRTYLPRLLGFSEISASDKIRPHSS